MNRLGGLLVPVIAAFLSAALLFALSAGLARPRLDDALPRVLAERAARKAPSGPGGMDMGTLPPPSNAARAVPMDALRFLGTERDLGRMSALARITALASHLGSGPVTLFVPTDEAFGRMTSPTYVQLLEAANAPLLVSTVRRHVARGAFSPEQLAATRRLQPLAGGALSVEASSGGIVLGGRSRVTERVRTADGWVYRIDEVLPRGRP